MGASGILLFLMLIGYGLAEMDAGTKKRISSGIDSGQKILDGIGKFGDPTSSKFFDSIQKMSGFLGAAGGLVSLALIFIPTRDSAELTYMKTKFSEVNMKLDKVTEELNNIKNLITFENQRSVYLADASKILHGYDQFNHFFKDVIDVSCTTETDCLRKRLRIAESYEKAFNIKQYLHKILKGSVAKTSVFGEPLLDLVKTTYKCDVSKIDYFANGVLKLAFKGQSVILAHERLTASNYSIVTSMKDWLTLVYNIRSKANEVKNDCYNNIKTYMTQDINDKTYQVNVKTNQEAVVKMKQFLDKKYPWVYWVTFSYGAFGSKEHWIICKDGTFCNMPKNKNDRKRNIIVIPQDKGTYLQQRVKFAPALKSSVEKVRILFVNRKNAQKIHHAVSEELKKNAVWRYIKSFNVLKTYDNFQSNVDTHHHLYWYNEELAFQTCTKKNRCNEKYNARFIAVFKSQEEIDGVSCRMKCNLHGTCRQLPLATTEFCECQPFYQGRTCESRTRAELASNIEAIFSVTFQIPKLTDIYFEMKDMRGFLGASLNKVLSTIISLEQKMKKSFDNLEKKITQKFRWSGLLTQYTNAITNLKYYLHRFQTLPIDNEERALEESKKVASRILSPDGVQKWLFELNYLFVGRSDFSLSKHDPLLIILMDNHKHSACSKAYKDALDNAWRQLVLLQCHGFLIWVQALDIKNKPSDWVIDKFKETSKKQISVMKEATCEIQIASSSNLQSCVNGYYLHPGLIVENRCKANYYVVGSLTTKCKSITSSCKGCGCNPEGATSKECSDLSGDCTCNKNHFKGKKCYDRDCKWSSWQSWKACNTSCDYGGKQIRIRTTVVTKAGNGKSCSANEGINTRSCFNGCCPEQYHCSQKMKCIPSVQRCDYKNNCGDNQDEASCSESCTTKYTSFNTDGGGDAVYLDRHRLSCSRNEYVLKSFKMERSGNKIRYRYVCCRLTSRVCSLRKVVNGFTDDGNGKTFYLDRQKISCGSYGFLTDYRLTRNSGHDKWRYEYNCCDVMTSRRSNVNCYSSATSYTSDGKGKSYYLDRQHLSCRSRYFLQYFKLERNNRQTEWRYVYRCCRIVP